MKIILRVIALVVISTVSIAYAGVLSVSSPKQKDTWISGKTYTIKWRYEYEPSNPLIELYNPISNNKVGTIATPNNSNYTSCGEKTYCYNWKIPSNLNNLIRTIKISIGSIYGYSGDFKIVKEKKLTIIPKVHINLNN